MTPPMQSEGIFAGFLVAIFAGGAVLARYYFLPALIARLEQRNASRKRARS